MTPSLPSLPGAAVTSELLPAATSTIALNQSDSVRSGGFGELLGEAYSALSPGAAGGITAPVDGEKLLAELQQFLPPDGKLLPLLQQTLDQVAAAGFDLNRFAEGLANKLKSLTQDIVMRPEQQLAVALQQLVQEQPALQSVLPTDTLAAVAASAASRSADASARLPAPAGTSNEATPAHRLAEPVQHKAIETPADLRQSGQQAVIAERGAITLETALSQLQHPAIGTQEQAALDTTALLAALKRAAGSNSASSTDALTRAEVSVSGAGAPTSVSPSGAPPTAGVPTVTVATAFGHADWDQALGDRIQWLVGQKVQGAQVRLNPANLGPMEVRIQMQNDQASIQFTAHHAVVREALEAALPRLREMLEASGVQLVDVDVSGQQSFADRQQAAEEQGIPYWANGLDGTESDQEIHSQTPLTAFSGRGRLDLFA